jgi:hypothetical protein
VNAPITAEIERSSLYVPYSFFESRCAKVILVISVQSIEIKYEENKKVPS